MGRSAAGRDQQVSADVLVTGRVHGVGFRYFVHAAACQLGLVGHVRNLPGGSVRAYAEGSRRAVEEFLRQLERGPAGARVHRLHVVWGTPTGQHARFVIEASR